MLIWHYTTTNVLNEFLKEDAKLYSTYIGFLNDTKEGEFSNKIIAANFQHIYNYIKSRIDITSENDFKEVYENLINTGLKYSRFITCFSKRMMICRSGEVMLQMGDMQ